MVAWYFSAGATYVARLWPFVHSLARFGKGIDCTSAGMLEPYVVTAGALTADCVALPLDVSLGTGASTRRSV